jgi:AmmeMemoRadiSam system protein B
MVRPPAVAGRFYPNEKVELIKQVASLCLPSVEAITNSADFDAHHAGRNAIACMVPHAGYRFSGRVAGSVYAALELPRRFLVVGPRHFPRGKQQAILSRGFWETPLGLAEIDCELADELKRACPALVEDEIAHREEHAIEVQLPFLQYEAQCSSRGFTFVPIALGTVDYGKLETLGQAMAAVIARQTQPVLIIASSDMNHYESDEITRRKDRLALDPLLALDPRGLYDVVRREGITMCGMGPAVSMLIAARQLGATRAELVRYATSGDVLGDRDEVVGYAGVIVS